MSTALWKLEKDLCRCCHAEGSFKHLSEPCFQLGQEEIYADMLQECLNMKINPISGALSDITYTICESCIVRLRDASNFKQQVAACEERFKEMYSKNLLRSGDGSGVKDEPEIDSDADMKVETLDETLEELDEDDDDAFLNFDDDDSDQEELPVEFEAPQAKGKGKAKPKPKPKKAPAKKPKAKAKPVKSETETLTEAAVSSDKRKGLLHSQMLRSKYCTIIEEEGIKKYQCAICERTYRNWALLRQHFLRCHLNLKKTTFPCSLCGEEIVPWTKARHLEQAHGVQPPTCKDCGKTFAFPNKLRHHQRIYHMGERNYSCEQCGLRTATNYALKYHMYTHATDRKFKCEFCSKAFKSPRDLKIHNRIHLDDKRFVCKVCDQAFVQSSNLRYHMNKRHPDVWIEPSHD